jgi:hypothetical protein
MILEGVVTTRNPDGSTNVAPMGPLTDEAVSFLTFRPWQTAQTCRNLQAHPEGVFHVIDDVYLVAQGAIGVWTEPVETVPAEQVLGAVIRSACRWYEFRVTDFDSSAERTTVRTEIVHVGRGRDYFGLNRAKHAVLEAAILATRLHLIPEAEIDAEWQRLRTPIEKTAGNRERAAFDLLTRYISEQRAKPRP